jgi:hypothetical protein
MLLCYSAISASSPLEGRLLGMGMRAQTRCQGGKEALRQFHRFVTTSRLGERAASRVSCENKERDP